MQKRKLLAIVIGAALAGFLGMRLFAAPPTAAPPTAALQRQVPQGPSLAALRSHLAQKDVEILQANAERDAALRLAIKNKMSAVTVAQSAVAASTAKEQHNSKLVMAAEAEKAELLASAELEKAALQEELAASQAQLKAALQEKLVATQAQLVQAQKAREDESIARKAVEQEAARKASEEEAATKAAEEEAATKAAEETALKTAAANAQMVEPELTIVTQPESILNTALLGSSAANPAAQPKEVAPTSEVAAISNRRETDSWMSEQVWVKPSKSAASAIVTSRTCPPAQNGPQTVCKQMNGKEPSYKQFNHQSKSNSRPKVPGLTTVWGDEALNPSISNENSLFLTHREKECAWTNMIHYPPAAPQVLPEEKDKMCKWGKPEWKGILHCDGNHWGYWGTYGKTAQCDAEHSIVMVTCGNLDGLGEHHSVYTTKTLLSYSHYMNPPSPCQHAKGKVIEFDKLVVTGQVYPAAVGHFVPQVLPRLIWVSSLLPDDVKVLVHSAGTAGPDGLVSKPGGIVQRYLEPLFAAKLLDRNRFVFVPQNQNAVYHAMQLYVPIPSHFEHIIHNAKGHNFARIVLLRALQAKKPQTQIPRDYRDKDIILVIHRTGTRAINNEGNMIKGIQNLLDTDPRFSPGAFFKHKLVIETFKPNPDVLDDVNMFDRAAMVVAPHGAGLANMMFASAGVPVLEICYESQETMQCPNMYYLQAITLGLPYWSLVNPGSYESKITANVGQVTKIVSTALGNLVDDSKRREYLKWYNGQLLAADWSGPVRQGD